MHRAYLASSVESILILALMGGTTSFVFLTTPNAYLTEYPGGSNSAFAAKVDFTRPAGQINCVVNGASLAAGRNRSGPDGSIAPGEIVSLFGQGFTPGPDLSVTFDGKPAPILYADSKQINAVVPFDVTSDNPLTLLSVNNAMESIRRVQAPRRPRFPRIIHP